MVEKKEDLKLWSEYVAYSSHVLSNPKEAHHNLLPGTKGLDN